MNRYGPTPFGYFHTHLAGFILLKLTFHLAERDIFNSQLAAVNPSNQTEFKQVNFIALSYLFKCASCLSHCSGWEGAADGRGDDEVTVEVVTSGLVGCMLVGSPVVRPHTLSTCGDHRENTHAPVKPGKHIAGGVEP